MVHRPDTDPPDRQATIDYITAIEIAIFELQSFMYPEDDLMKRMSIDRTPGQVVMLKGRRK